MPNTTKSKVKKTKKTKQTSIPVITRRLFRMASKCCRDNAGNKCEICGAKSGDSSPSGGKTKIEAHHIMSRDNKDSLLKFDLRNLIALCSQCHKFGKFSAHKHGIWFAEWLKTNKPEKYQWILDNSERTANLKDRKILDWIQDCLGKGLPLDDPPS